jgi:hypothetical protein
MLIPAWLPLLAKALTTALIVMTAAAAAEALGPLWGAIIASLPVSAGPAYVFLALRHGPGFVATGALSSAAANAATGLFLIIFGLRVRRGGFWRSLGLAVAVWLSLSLALQQVAWTVVRVVVLNLAVYGPGILLLRGPDVPEAGSRRPGSPRWYERPLRAAAVAAFVALVVAASAALGPAATGIAAVFPVSLISLLVLLHARLGRIATAQVAVRALPPMLGFCAMLLVLHGSVRPWGMPAAFGLALAVSILWSGGLLLLVPRR